jgi:hypothetical protein
MVIGCDERYLSHCQLHSESIQCTFTHLDLRVVRDRRLAVSSRYGHLEHAKVVLCHWCRIAVPVVEVTDEVCSKGVRRPFAVYDVAI